MKSIYKISAMFSIVLIAILLRFWELGSVPISPDWDEASLGYNAYSILKTGRDEYGTFLPLTIRSFGDYKPPLYTYLTVPSVGLFGLSVWSVRLPSAIMGVLAVIGVYFLVRELFSDSRLSSHLSVVTSLLLAISPWHIQFSRVAFEANVGVTLNILAVAAFLTGFRKRSYFQLSGLLFALGLYAYHSERVFLPLLIVLLSVVYRKRIFAKGNYPYIQRACVIGVLVALPLVPVFFNKSAMQRLTTTSVASQQTSLLSRTVKKLEFDRSRGDSLGMILDNRRIVWATSIASGYLSHFSLKWLFLTGDYYRHHAPDMGLLYLWELPFLLLGMYVVWRYQKGPIRSVLYGWLLIAPIAAAPTTDLPHAVRTLVFLPVFQIFTAVGLTAAVTRLGMYKAGFKRIGGICLGLIVLGAAVCNFAYYMDMYFTHQNAEFSKYWQYGYKEAVDFAEKNKKNYEKVVVSEGLDQSYIFFLFYLGYDPRKYLASGGTRPPSGDDLKNSFDSYVFKTIDWSRDVCDGKILYITTPGEMTHGTRVEIRYVNGEPAIEIGDHECKPKIVI